MDEAILLHLQVQVQLFSMSLLIASLQEKEASSSEEDKSALIPPVPAITAAQLGIELHQKFGGGKNLKLAKAIAEKQWLTSQDVDAILNFFENNELDENAPGWGNHENPSQDWICYLLMGGNACLRWARQIKNWLNGKGEKPTHKVGLPPRCRSL